MRKILCILVILIVICYHGQAQHLMKSKPSKHYNNLNLLNDAFNEAELEKALTEYLDQDNHKLPSENELLIPQRDKKNKGYNKEEEKSPLTSHGKKNGDSIFTETEKQPTCSSQFKSEPNVIIDSKASIEKGAKLVRIEYVNKETALQGLNKLQESCMNQCCNSDSCDSALLSMRLGPDGYRCYLFACNQNCMYVKHNDYIVLRMKSPEQVDHSLNKEVNEITTGHKEQKTPCHKQYEFTCLKSKKCIPIYDVCNTFDDCDDKTDELNCTTTTFKAKTTSSKKPVTTPKKLNKVDLTYLEPKDETNSIDETDSEIIEDLLKEKKIENDYDNYELAKKQAELVDYLNHLFETEHKKKVVQNSPFNFFDSFMKTSAISFKTIPSRTSTKTISTTSTTKKFIFHDEYNLNAENVISNFNQDDKIFFSNKENAITSTSSIATAVILLVLGISLVVAFFTYLIMSTKYMSKRVKWLNKFNSKQKNVDVDPTFEADFLINGMYL